MKNRRHKRLELVRTLLTGACATGSVWDPAGRKRVAEAFSLADAVLTALDAYEPAASKAEETADRVADAVGALDYFHGPPEHNNPGGPLWVSPDLFGRPPAPVTETTPRREGEGYVYDTCEVPAPDLPEPTDEMPATVRSTPPPALLAVETHAPDGALADDAGALCDEDCPVAAHVHEIDVGEG